MRYKHELVVELTDFGLWLLVWSSLHFLGAPWYIWVVVVFGWLSCPPLRYVTPHYKAHKYYLTHGHKFFKEKERNDS
jgi:hypothetical protein